MTPHQLDVLRFIDSFIAEHAYPPSFEEIVRSGRAKGKSSASRILGELEAQGVLTKVPRKFRSLELTPKAARFLGARRSAGPQPLLNEASEDQLVDELKRRGWQFLGRR